MTARSSPGLARQVVADPVHWAAFGLGSGLLPGAPGTWGSLAATVGAWFVMPVPATAGWVALAAAFVAGIPICGASARRLGLHDHPGIVLDEIVAMLAVLMLVPHDPAWYLAALVAFRGFDIFKPWPIREIDHRLPGGLGIMVDDVVAAVYAGLLLELAQRAFAML